MAPGDRPRDVSIRIVCTRCLASRRPYGSRGQLHRVGRPEVLYLLGCEPCRLCGATTVTRTETPIRRRYP